LIKERNIELIVVGLPLNEDGSRNEQCSHVENFCRRLRKRVDIRLEFFDEYLSSMEAEEMIGGSRAKLREAREQGLIDSMAAAIILKNYLESRKV
jgi:putative Holliday junction resolvase